MRMVLRALVTGYLRRNLLRSLVTLAAVTLGVALAYAIDLANATAVASFTTSVDVIANHVNLQIFGVGRGFDERVLLRVEDQPGVESASPVVQGEIAIGSSADAPFRGELLHVMGIDITRATLPPGAAAAQSGSRLDLDTYINHRGIFVSRRIASAYHLRVGSTLRGYAGPRRIAFAVSGVIPANANVDSSVAFVDIVTAQEAFRKVGRLDRIDCIVDPKRLSAVQRALRASLPPGTRAIEPRVRTGEIERLLQSFQMNLTALAYMALVVAMYLIYNAVAISVVQRKNEIGTLRAVGARRGQIFTAFLTEGAFFGVVGSLLGLVLGAFLARYSVGAVSHTVSELFVGSHADGVTYTAGATLSAFLTGVALAVVSALAPAIDAARTAPAVTMRAAGSYERRLPGYSRVTAIAGVVSLALAALTSRLPSLGGLPVFGYVSAVLVIAGASLCVPLLLVAVLKLLRTARTRQLPPFILALAGLRASQRRFSVAIGALMIAVGMTVAVAILIGSFRATVVAWADRTLAADLYVGPPGALDASSHGYFTPGMVRTIAAVAGVETVNTYRGFEVPFRGRMVQLGATKFLVDLPALAGLMRSGTYVAVSDPFVNKFGLRTGDHFTIGTPSGVQRFTIAGEYDDYSTSEGTFVMSSRTYRRLFHDDLVDSVAVYVRPHADVAAVRSAIVRAIAPLHADISTNREIRAYVLDVFNRTFAITGALYVISIAIAVLGVVSTLFALILERRTEIALLRDLGLTVGGVRRMVYAQAAVIGLLAGIFGVVVGIALSLVLIYVINRQSFGWSIALHVPWAFFGEAIGGVVLVALLAAIYPAGVAARIRTAEALRAE